MIPDDPSKLVTISALLKLRRKTHEGHMQLRILVTGGAGYIGSHTTLALLAAGHDVCVIDNFCNSNPRILENVYQISKRAFEVENLDIRDRRRMANVVQQFRPAQVIHFAALKSIAAGQMQSIEYFDVNVGGTISLLHALEGTNCRHVVFSSSAAVYGGPETAPFSESHMPQPSNVYGRSKRMAEQVIEDWVSSAASNVSATLLRYFNPVGAHLSGLISDATATDAENLVPILMQVASGKRATFNLYGNDYDTPDGSCVRDFIHIDDLVDAHIAAVESASRQTNAIRVFNIGSGQGTSVSRVIKAFEEVIKIAIPVTVAPRRDGDVAVVYASCEKIQQELGWRGKRTLEEMLFSSWRAYRHFLETEFCEI